MNMEWNWKSILIVSLAAVVFLGTNIGQYYAIWQPKQEKMKTAYEGQIDDLQAKLDAIGPMVPIWTVAEDAPDLYPGKVVEHSDLAYQEIPESLLNRSFILEPDTIVGKYYKIALHGGTPLSMDLVMNEPLEDTIREFDVVASMLPIGLKVGDYVDYRIVYPLGEDFIVLTHKRIEAINDKTIKFKLNETEIHYYQAALIDYLLNKDKGSILYMAKYVEPGLQKPATEYYAIPANIEAVMLADPNILEKIDGDMNATMRKLIEAGIGNVSDEDGNKIASGRSEIAGKIDSGDKEAKDQEKARLEDQQKQQEQGQTQQPYVPPEDTSSNFERGVVE
ncbi:hypothetical protein [Cohnella cellulosilytica]|uniref:SAF domain-containing protein n=1 Tax=Cohnella cellulosilytica TaxID=986710 RepID=A0ABW2F8F2_9BACL